MGFKLVSKGEWKRTKLFLKRNRNARRRNILSRYGDVGVRLLAGATPKDSGITANSWYYQIKEEEGKSTLYFCNSSQNKGVPIAIILQYGHGTGTGGWVQGRDYINPAIQPVFDALADSIWKEVSSD